MEAFLSLRTALQPVPNAVTGFQSAWRFLKLHLSINSVNCRTSSAESELIQYGLEWRCPLCHQILSRLYLPEQSWGMLLVDFDGRWAKRFSTSSRTRGFLLMVFHLKLRSIKLPAAIIVHVVTHSEMISSYICMLLNFDTTLYAFLSSRTATASGDADGGLQ